MVERREGLRLTPFRTPWRTVVVGDTPGDLATSRLMLNLNEPSKIEDTSWIRPGKYIGIWWSMHLFQETWAQGPEHGATTENMMRYIDFAAENGIRGVLAEDGTSAGTAHGPRTPTGSVSRSPIPTSTSPGSPNTPPARAWS